MLSNACKYAIRAVIYIALNGEVECKIGIKEIAGELKIPEHFLGKIMQKLVKMKILHSSKGPNGGFYIGKENKNLSLYDVVVSIEGKDMFEKCLISFRSCYEEKKPCPIHNVYQKVRNEMINFYKKQLIMEIAKEISDTKKEFIL